VLTTKIVIGQFNPPMAVNLMVSRRIAEVFMECTIPWEPWMVLAMRVALMRVVTFPCIALWVHGIMEVL